MAVEGTISVEWPISRARDGRWTVGGDHTATEAAWRANEAASGIDGVLARCANLFLDTWSWPDGPPSGLAWIEHLTTGEQGPLTRNDAGLWVANWCTTAERDQAGLPWSEWAARWRCINITVWPENRVDMEGPRQNGFVFADFIVTQESDDQWTVQDYLTATERQWRAIAGASDAAGSLATAVVQFLEQCVDRDGPDAGEAWLTHLSTGSRFKLVRVGDGWVRCETEGEAPVGQAHPWNFWVHDIDSVWMVNVCEPALAMSA